MGLVRGEDVILTVEQFDGTSNVYVPFGCARSVTFDISTDFIETSVTESGSFKTFLPSGKQYSGNIEGLVFLNKPATGSNTSATVVLDFSSLSGFFPGLDCNGYSFSDYPTFEAVNLGPVINGVALNLSIFLMDINSIINTYNSAFLTGYTSVISGNTIIITAPSSLGATINGFTAHCNYDIDGNTGTITGTFANGTDGFYPDKLGIGWFYDNLLQSTEVQIKYYETDDDNHFLQKVCNVYIESINETASFDNMVTYTAAFKGNGTPTITYGEI